MCYLRGWTSVIFIFRILDLADFLNVTRPRISLAPKSCFRLMLASRLLIIFAPSSGFEQGFFVVVVGIVVVVVVVVVTGTVGGATGASVGIHLTHVLQSVNSKVSSGITSPINLLRQI